MRNKHDHARSTIQSLERSIRIIVELSKAADGISLTDLSARTGLHKATISRILKTLSKEHFARQDSYSSRYLLGPRVLDIAFDYLNKMELRQIALPHMKALRDATEETINLAILYQTEVIYIERVESLHTLRTTSTIGKRDPAHCTSLGKVLLAYADPEIVRRILREQPLERLTPQTKTNPDEIESELAQVRHSNVAIDDRESREYIRCTAAPVFDGRAEVVAAVGISGPSSRITMERLSELQKLVRKTAQDISRDLGWTMAPRKRQRHSAATHG